MCELLIFGGTAEGRSLAEFCAENKIKAAVSVTTDYGEELLPKSEYVRAINGRLDKSDITKLISENSFSLVVDATHPYAVLATENIRLACTEAEVKYFRLKRESSQLFGAVLKSLDELIDYLNTNNKIILSTLGSKELPLLSKICNCHERLWVRVLPVDGIKEYCISCGIDANKIILGKGPFTVQENTEHIIKSGAQILVTKESGATGGYPEKAAAAQELGAELITIKRPEESGSTAEEIKEIILKEAR